MLDSMASKYKDIGHPLIGRFRAQPFALAQKFCRIGSIANTIRRAIDTLTSRGVPTSRWKRICTWTDVLPGKGFVDGRQCRDAYSAALVQRSSDHTSECLIFGVSPVIEISEDWEDRAWDDPSALDLDRRAQYLDFPSPIPDGEF